MEVNHHDGRASNYMPYVLYAIASLNKQLLIHGFLELADRDYHQLTMARIA